MKTSFIKTALLLAGAAFIAATVGQVAHAAETLTMWLHSAGSDVETRNFQAIARDFNASQDQWEVVIQSFPQTVYNDSIIAAALAGNLPDIIDVDGPIMPNWAWSGYLQPLEIDEAKLADFLPGTKGYWNGKLYAVGVWDAAVALATRQSYLDELGLRRPTLDNPWDEQEFMAALDKAKASGKFKYALDLGLADCCEWAPYAIAPFLQSFGGDLVDRATYKSAEGVLNDEAAIRWGEWWQGLFQNGYAQAQQDPAARETGFDSGDYAFSLSGNWRALSMLEVFDDALFLPMPDFGHGGKIGAASWQFAISATSQHPQGAAQFIDFMLQDKYFAALSDGTGLIPPTTTAAAITKEYGEGGKLAVFYQLSSHQALIRPVTPGYIVASKIFDKALRDIANGANVRDTLDAAVDEIDADIKNNNGYGH